VGTPIHRHEARKQKGNFSLTPDLLRIFKKGNFDEANVLRRPKQAREKNPACFNESFKTIQQ